MADSIEQDNINFLWTQTKKAEYIDIMKSK